MIHEKVSSRYLDVASLDGFFSWKCRWPVMKLPLNDVIMDVTAKRHWKGGEFLRTNYVMINETGWTVAAERRDCERGWKILQPRREFFHRRPFLFLSLVSFSLLSSFFLFPSLLFSSRCWKLALDPNENRGLKRKKFLEINRIAISTQRCRGLRT